MTSATKARNTRSHRYLNSFNYLGVIVGSVFVYCGFLPTLLPRGWVLQGVMSGILFSIGYGIGLVISSIIRALNFKEQPDAQKVQIKKVTYITLAVLYLIGVIVGFNWQQEVRKLVEQPP